MEVNSSLPYYNYTVDDIEHGNYRLMIKLKTTDEVVKQLEFEIISEDDLADAISETVVDNKIIDSFLENIDLLNENSNNE